MLTLAATLGEVAASRLRMLARAIEGPGEAGERDAANRALNHVITKLAGQHRHLSVSILGEARRSARQEMARILQGELQKNEVEAWAAWWTAWVTAVDARAALLREGEREGEKGGEEEGEGEVDLGKHRGPEEGKTEGTEVRSVAQGGGDRGV